MKKLLSIILGVILLPLASQVQASGAQNAIIACNFAIQKAYGVDKFRGTVVEKQGHKKFIVHGDVRTHSGRYPYSCRVKRGQVSSYTYRGPVGNKHNHGGGDHHDAAGKIIAAGIGLAIVAALSSHDKKYTSKVDTQYLEDECHDAISNRIKGEHHSARRISFTEDKIKHQGLTVKGYGQVKWRHHRHSSLKFACHFNRHGHLIDTSYSFN